MPQGRTRPGDDQAGDEPGGALAKGTEQPPPVGVGTGEFKMARDAGQAATPDTFPLTALNWGQWQRVRQSV